MNRALKKKSFGIWWLFIVTSVVAVFLQIDLGTRLTVTVFNKSASPTVNGELIQGRQTHSISRIEPGETWKAILDPFEEGEVTLKVTDSHGKTSSASFYVSPLSAGEKVNFEYDGNELRN